MAERKDKKFYREMKREIKKEGGKRRRAYYKQNLLQNPAEAHWCEEYIFGDLNSAQFNGMDNDSTRCRDFLSDNGLKDTQE